MKSSKNIAPVRLLLITAICLLAFTGYAQVSTGKDDGISPKLREIVTAESKKGWHRFAEGITLDPAYPEKFFEEHREAFGFTEGYGMILTSHRTEEKLGMDHYHFQQTHKGIPIAGAEYILHQRKDGSLKGNGNIIADFSKDDQPAISGDEALKLALDQVKAVRYAWEDPKFEEMIKKQQGEKATFYPQPRLMFAPSDDADVPAYTLAYELKVYAISPESNQQFYISAADGRVLRVVNLIHDSNTPATGTTIYNGVKSFVSDFTGSNYRLRETNRGGSGTSISTYDMNESTDFNMAVDFQNNSTAWLAEPVGVQGHWSAEKTFDYFYSVHGRNSFNNSGGEIIAYLDYGANFNNASWNGVFMRFGSGDGVNKTSWASLDVVGHEFTHGVTEYSAGLVYLNESGALNESFSDIFGTTIEFHVQGSGDWLVSEDVTINGAGIRSMVNPNAFSDPDTYHGTFWEFTGNDNGGVHTNSGVQNHWFYLLTEGGSGTNDHGNSFSVTGIGIDMAAAIAYRNLTEYLLPDSRYSDAREGALEAAEDLYGRTSDAYAQTAMAWYAVGVGYPVYASDDLGLRSVIVSGESCNQISVELVNLSTTGTIPADALISIVITEDGVARPAEQITLPFALAPGISVIIPLSQTITSTEGKIDVETEVTYLPDPEPGNNTSTLHILRGTLTVGGTDPDYLNINAAVEALKDPDVVLCGHLDFRIRNGQYNGEVRMMDMPAVSSANTVTFQSETGNHSDVTLFSSINFSSAYGALNLERVSGIRIKNITITRQPVQGVAAVGVALRGQVHDIVLEGNKIRCNGTSQYRTNLESQPYGELQSNITIRNNLFEAATLGIDCDPNNTNNDILIENNRLNNHQEPIQVWGNNITVRKNRITTSVLINLGAGVFANAAGELLLEGNELVITALNMTNVSALDVSSSGYAKVYNNMISINGSSAFDGITVGNVGTGEFFHNTVRLQKVGSGTASPSAINFEAGEVAAAVWNNIFSSITNGAVGIRINAGDIASNGNNFHFPNGFIGRKGGQFATLQQWQNATGLDMNSTTGEALFVSDTDLHLVSQWGLRSTITTILTSDIDGEVRSSFFPYMGADERYLENTGDIAITGIRLLDQGSLCERMAVQIDIKNTGSIPYAAGMQIPVSHRVNGTNAATETVTVQQNFNVGATITYTFETLAIFQTSQNHILTARIDRDDANTGNNASTEVSVAGIGQYTIGGTDPDFPTIKHAMDFLSAAVFPCDLPLISFHIRSGVYPQSVSIIEIPGSALSFESETGNKEDVVLTSATASTLILPGSKRVTFKNLTIEYLGLTTTEAAVLVKNNCEDITITNCNFSMAVLATEHYAIKAGPSDGPTLNGFHLSKNVFTNGGIKMESNANVSHPYDNIEIDSNTFVNAYGHAVFLNRTGLVRISDNNIIATNTSSGISITQPLKDVRIERNRITLEAGVNGIYFYNLIPSFSRIYVFNNFVEMKSGANDVNGIFIQGKGGYLYHNTVRLSTGPVQPTGTAAALSTRNNGIAIRHNILYSTMTNAIGIDRLNSSSYQDHNNIHVPAGVTVRQDLTNYATLAEWQLAANLDLQSTDVAPLFVSATDLHLASYQTELKGSNASLYPAVQTDIDGEPRSVPAFMGADEHPPVPYIELDNNPITNIPLFGESYYIDVDSNSDWIIATPLQDGISVDQVTPYGFMIHVSANPSNTPRELSVTLQTTESPVATEILYLYQEGVPALTGTPGNASAILNWTANTGATVNYRIYFSEGGPSATTLLATLPGNETTFTHTGLVNGTTYAYQLSVVDSTGNESALSAAVTIIPVPPFIQLSPEAITDVPVFGRSFTIDVNSNTGWIIEEPVPSEVTISNITVASFSVAVSPNPLSTTREVFLTIHTAESPVATASLHLIQDGPPALTADGINTAVVLNWTETPGRILQYNVYLVGKKGILLLTSVAGTKTTFTHTGLTNGVTYSYQVSAVEMRGQESGLSNVASATPFGRSFGTLKGQSLTIYPNPTEDELSLTGEMKTAGSYTVTIIDSYGMPALKQEFYSERGEIDPVLHVNKLSPGIYLLRVTDPSGNVIETIRFEKK